MTMLPRKETEHFKHVLKKFSKSEELVITTPPSSQESSKEEDIKLVNGKEEFSIRFDKESAFATIKDAGRPKNISCSSNAGDEIAQRIKGKLT